MNWVYDSSCSLYPGTGNTQIETKNSTEWKTTGVRRPCWTAFQWLTASEDDEMLRCTSATGSIHGIRPSFSFSKSRPRISPLRAKNDKDVVYGDPITRAIDGLLGGGPPPIEPQFEGEKLEGLSLEEMKEKLIEGVTATRWFVTGRVDYRLFSSEKFRFKDPSVEVCSFTYNPYSTTHN